jgi:oligoribonuclease NrnB/cAMP/cGMP phosphodiesterase (DHH superfamily)
MNWRPDVCIYHGGCDDGFGAALAVWMKWGDSVIYVPAVHDQPINTNVDGLNVLMVDFSLKRQAMIDFSATAKSVVVLDHHKTAQDELADWCLKDDIPLNARLKSLDDHTYTDNGIGILAIFDMNKSGASMTWQFVFETNELPTLIRYIEDRDLWRFAYGEDTHMVIAALRSYPQEFEIWDKFLDNCTELLVEGEPILRAHRKMVKDICKSAYIRQYDEHAGVPVVNAPYIFASDCANYLLKKYPDAPYAVSWCFVDGVYNFSLRSEDSRVDVSEIAKKRGGGGHRNAAGFKW